MATPTHAPIAEQIALLDAMIGDLQDECARADRHHAGTPEMRSHRWRRLRTLRDVRRSVHRWNQVVMLNGDLAALVALKSDQPMGDDARADAAI